LVAPCWIIVVLLPPPPIGTYTGEGAKLVVPVLAVGFFGVDEAELKVIKFPSQ
jgi:hypothetical protein